MTSLKNILEFREALIEEKQRFHEKLEICKGRLNSINGLLDGFGVENFTKYVPGEKFNPIINEKKNKGFFH